MSETPKDKPFPKAVVIAVVLAITFLAIIFVVLAFIGDDVPNNLPPASQTSPGD